MNGQLAMDPTKAEFESWTNIQSSLIWADLQAVATTVSGSLMPLSGCTVTMPCTIAFWICFAKKISSLGKLASLLPHQCNALKRPCGRGERGLCSSLYTGGPRRHALLQSLAATTTGFIFIKMQESYTPVLSNNNYEFLASQECETILPVCPKQLLQGKRKGNTQRGFEARARHRGCSLYGHWLKRMTNNPCKHFIARPRNTKQTAVRDRPNSRRGTRELWRVRISKTPILQG